MLRKSLYALLIMLVLIVLYFLAWPVPIEPVAWKAPPNPGYTGPFAQNELLKAIEFLKIGPNYGPEDVAIDDQGRIYLAAHEGVIVRLQPDGAKPENWVNTNGRALGIDFDSAGNLIVADAFRGSLVHFSGREDHRTGNHCRWYPNPLCRRCRLRCGWKDLLLGCVHEIWS